MSAASSQQRVAERAGPAATGQRREAATRWPVRGHRRQSIRLRQGRAHGQCDRTRPPDAVLSECGRVDPGRAHDIGVEGPAEEAALIHMRDRLEQHRTGNAWHRADVHRAARHGQHLRPACCVGLRRSRRCGSGLAGASGWRAGSSVNVLGDLGAGHRELRAALAAEHLVEEAGGQQLPDPSQPHEP